MSTMYYLDIRKVKLDLTNKEDIEKWILLTAADKIIKDEIEIDIEIPKEVAILCFDTIFYNSCSNTRNISISKQDNLLEISYEVGTKNKDKLIEKIILFLAKYYVSGEAYICTFDRDDGGYNVDLISLQNDLNNVSIDDFRIYDINNKYLKEV